MELWEKATDRERQERIILRECWRQKKMSRGKQGRVMTILGRFYKLKLRFMTILQNHGLFDWILCKFFTWKANLMAIGY